MDNEIQELLIEAEARLRTSIDATWALSITDHDNLVKAHELLRMILRQYLKQEEDDDLAKL